MREDTKPEFLKEVFSCPYCHITANHTWFTKCKAYEKTTYGAGTTVVRTGEFPIKEIPGLSASKCVHCGKETIWYDKKIVHPIISIAPFPTEDMPEVVKIDYLEARLIVDKSPRAAAALLRLALQKLMPYIGESGKNINDDIASLVKKGLDEHIQQSLDIVRVIGNEAVHPGQIDIKDDQKMALFLFDLLNLIVENKISHPKRIEGVYQRLPLDKIRGILNRDKK